MNSSWRTAWQGPDIVVFRDDEEIDRLQADQIERVVLVHQGRGDTPGDLLYALVELPQDVLLFPAETGFAGRVNFERQAFWAERNCIYWVANAQAHLPLRFRTAHWWLRLSGPSYARVPRDQFAGSLEQWPLEGPQTWEQRKWRRIAQARPFSSAHDKVT